uniref:Uncharacterized protein n=1 Tax=Rhizophora mucronata TaxID=61149 RepID=A0A2P2QJA7_RHIMU
MTVRKKIMHFFLIASKQVNQIN